MSKKNWSHKTSRCPPSVFWDRLLEPLWASSLGGDQFGGQRTGPFCPSGTGNSD